MKNALLAAVFLSVALPCGFHATSVEAQLVGGRFPARSTKTQEQRLSERLSDAEDRLADIEERLETLRGPEETPNTLTPAQQREVEELMRQKARVQADIDRLSARLNDD